MILTEPPNHLHNTRTNAEPICEASHRNSPHNQTPLPQIVTTKFLVEQGRIFQTRSAQAKRFIIGCCKLLEPVTDERLRKLFDQDLLAHQGKISKILYGNLSQADAHIFPQAASGHANPSDPAQVIEPPEQNLASLTRLV